MKPFLLTVFLTLTVLFTYRSVDKLLDFSVLESLVLTLIESLEKAEDLENAEDLDRPAILAKPVSPSPLENNDAPASAIIAATGATSLTSLVNVEEQLERALTIASGGRLREIVYADFFDEIGMPASRKESILMSLELAKQLRLEVTQKYVSGAAPPDGFYEELTLYSPTTVVKRLLDDNEYRDFRQWLIEESKK